MARTIFATWATGLLAAPAVLLGGCWLLIHGLPALTRFLDCMTGAG